MGKQEMHTNFGLTVGSHYLMTLYQLQHVFSIII